MIYCKLNRGALKMLLVKTNGRYYLVDSEDTQGYYRLALEKSEKNPSFVDKPFALPIKVLKDGDALEEKYGLLDVRK